MIAPRMRGALLVGSVLAFAAACGNGTEPNNNNGPAKIAPVSGNNQTGLIGTALSLPLVVKVTSSAGTPVNGVSVTFAVTSGAANVNPATATTDANGQAQTIVTLGSAPGNVVITATAAGASAAATFTLAAGTTSVTTACSSSSSPQSPAAGVVLPGVSGTGICLSGGASGASYALVAFNSNPDSTLASSSLTVRSTGAVPMANPDPASQDVFPSAMQLGANIQQRFDVHLRTIAKRELASRIPAARAWYSQRNSGTRALFNAIPSSVSVGQMLTLNAQGNDACSNPINVRGRVVAISNSAIVVADSLNPPGGFTDAEYASFATTFDTLINPLDVNAFGQPSDIDKNGKVLVLFTKEVNKLTPRGSQGVVGGFFFERDLFPLVDANGLQGCAGSNQGEMFYMLVPDISGTFSDARQKSDVLTLTIGTLAHEYQHLINAGRRLFINNADVFESVWLNEGLSHIAEELLFYRQSGLQPRQNIGVSAIRPTATQAAFFNDQFDNLERFELFIEKPSQVGVYAANDSLETRGADWNLLRYLADHRGSADADTWQLLVNSKTAGLDNLANVFGSTIMTQIRDWATSVYTDDLGCAINVSTCQSVVSDARYQEPSWWHRSIFPNLCIDNNNPCTALAKYPLQYTPLSDGSPANLSIVAGGEAYFRFSVPAGSQASIDWSSGGLPVPPLMQFTVVRIQ